MTQVPVSSVLVPYDGPPNAKVIFVGEAPGVEEERQKLPFVGESGDLLTNVLQRNGWLRKEVLLANLCRYRPLPTNKFDNIPEDVLTRELSILYSVIDTIQPNIIVPLGSEPLKYLTGKESISRWRGSIIPYIHDKTIKCIPTYHPAYVLRDRSKYPIFDVDIQRIYGDASYRDFHIPQRKYVLDPKGLDLEEWTQKLEQSERLAVDIETVKNSRHILCVGFSPAPNIGVSISTSTIQAQLAVRRILESPARKIFHFGTFDTLQLLLNGYKVNNYWWDTLVAQHALNPELPRSLSFLTSIYTRQPYYKKEGRGEIPGDVKGWSLKESKDKLYEYNAKDVCVTAEIQLEQEKELNENIRSKSTFDFEMSELEMVHDISMVGLLRDEERRSFVERALKTKLVQRQFILDGLCKQPVNVRSPKLKNILYGTQNNGGIGLPERRNRTGGTTTDEDAIVSLIAFCKGELQNKVKESTILEWKVKLAVCQVILEIRGIRQLLSNYVCKKADDDGRIRSTFKVAATETGRYSAEKFVDGSGLNAQTMPREELDIPDKLLKDLDNVQVDDEGDETEGSDGSDDEDSGDDS